MLKTLFRKTGSFITHLRHGTAGKRFQEVFRELLHEWRGDSFWLDNYPGWGNSFVYPLLEGVRMRLYRDDRLSELIYKRNFEANERAFVCHYLKPGMCFVDVGANIGLYSLIAAKMVGPSGFVYSFEPASKTYRRLLHNIRLNKFKNIRAKQAALSERDEIRDLVVYSREYSAWNSLGGQIVKERMARKERVQCIRLDRFVIEADLCDRINLMKIDVEGWEWYVLKGGTNTLEAPNALDLIIEFSDENLKTVGISADAIYNLLKHFGYTLYRIDSTGKRLISERFGENHPYDNYFATQKLARSLELTGYIHENL